MGALLLLRDRTVTYESELRSYSTERLLDSTMKVVKIEHAATIEAIRHFAEIHRRRLFAACGYSSLFEMLTRHYGYCRASAQVRINSMRLMNDIPEAEKKIESGELTLTAASQVQSFLAAEKRDLKNYSSEQKLELVQTCSGKSTREVERELAARNPEAAKREVVRAVSGTTSRMNVSVDNELLLKLDRVKEVLSHSRPTMTYEEVFRVSVEIALDKLDPLRKAERAYKRAEKKKVKLDL